ncbi:hypothetical protein BTVI_34979 [Pitangus sulphuratus]|nr:hypothetical protein BTVI_34979 [Pitangus sulphuratus]
MPEQVFDPDKMACHLTEGCFSYDDPNMQFFALYWGLASAYRAAVDYSQRPKAETETQTMPPKNSAVPIRSIDIGIQTQPGVNTVSTKSTEIGTQTQPRASTASASPSETGTQTMDFMENGIQTTPPETTLTPVVKKKSWIQVPPSITQRTTEDQSQSDDLGAGSSTDTSTSTPLMNLKRERESWRSMTPAELRDLRRDYRCLPGERILTWLLRCQDNGAIGHLLEEYEAQQLGSIAGDHELDKLIADKKTVCSLWVRLVTSVKKKYPSREYLTWYPRKWTKAEGTIQYLRELAMLELIYDNNNQYNSVNDEPEGVLCTLPMWRKLPRPPVRERPSEYFKYEDHYRDYRDRDYRDYTDRSVEWSRSQSRFWSWSDRDYRDYRDRSVEWSRSQSRSWSWSRSRSPSFTRRRENPKRRSLWSYLRNQGEDMRKWDGEPTSKLEATVRELRRKNANKKVIYVVDADVLERKLPSLRCILASEVRFHDDKKSSHEAQQRSDSECSDQDQ